MNAQPKVTLLSAPEFPLETLYVLRQSTLNNDPIRTPADIAYESLEMPSSGLEEKVLAMFEEVLNEGIPIAETLHFVFMIENVSISFREQMVRHRIGVKNGERLGVDIIPDLPDSTWWSQSMRVLDMSGFATNRQYRMPGGLTPQQEASFHSHMLAIEKCYQELLKDGVPAEEAREILPLGTTHRISWTLNMAAIKHILGKRACWILQAGLWAPVIQGMVNELADKVHPIFRKLVSPPCISKGKFSSCPFEGSNRERIQDGEPLPPCPLWMEKRPEAATQMIELSPRKTSWQAIPHPTEGWTAFQTSDMNQALKSENMRREFETNWGISLETGLPLKTDLR